MAKFDGSNFDRMDDTDKIIVAIGEEPWDRLDREFQAYLDDIRSLLQEFLSGERGAR
jgi:hypothetical protein